MSTDGYSSGTCVVSVALAAAGRTDGSSGGLASLGLAYAWRKGFLDALAATEGHVGNSCELAGISYSTAYRHREADPAFREEWDAVVDSVWPEIREAFLELYENTGSIQGSCRKLGIHRTLIRRMRAKDESFSRRMADVDDSWVEMAEAGLAQRAVFGVRKPVIRPTRKTKDKKGTETWDYEKVAEEVVYSHAREAFYLSRKRPQRWGVEALRQESASVADQARIMRENLAAMLETMDQDDLPGELPEEAEQDGPGA